MAGVLGNKPVGSAKFDQLTKEGLLVAKYGGTTLAPMGIQDALPAALSRGKWV